MGLAETLEQGRREFLDAVATVAAERAKVKPAGGGWTLLEIVEHVIEVERRHQAWIEAGHAARRERDPDREIKLFSRMRSRDTKVDSPEALRPAGRFSALAPALEEFRHTRDRTLGLLNERGSALYEVGVRHPFFGWVNGIELLNLIDGHARRHAEQIRELGDDLARKPGGLRLDAPDLPAELEPGLPAVSEEGLLACDGRLVEETVLSGAESVRIEGSVLRRVRFAEGTIGSLVLRDVRLEGCDLANVRARRLSLLRVEFLDCRLTGFCSTSAEGHAVFARECDFRWAQLPGASFRFSHFENCRFLEADLQGADLRGSSLRGCQLGQADLQRAKLEGTDLRGSEVEQMAVGLNDLQGAVVDAAQAMVFARLLGLRIE